MPKNTFFVYFFKNGDPYKVPRKITKEEVEKRAKSENDDTPAIYDLNGMEVKSTTNLQHGAAYVFADKDDDFLPGPYRNVFKKYVTSESITRTPSNLLQRKDCPK